MIQGVWELWGFRGPDRSRVEGRENQLKGCQWILGIQGSGDPEFKAEPDFQGHQRIWSSEFQDSGDFQDQADPRGSGAQGDPDLVILGSMWVQAIMKGQVPMMHAPF